MEDKVLAQMLLEFGFLTEEQIEKAFKSQKESREERTLGQLLIQEGIVTVRALKTIHAAEERRREAQEQEEMLRRTLESSRRRTKSLEKPKKQYTPVDKTAETGPETSKDFAQAEKEVEEQATGDVTLADLKKEISGMREDIAKLASEVKSLKENLKK